MEEADAISLMCGIAGIIDFSQPPRPERVRRMIAALHHRGPDHLQVAVDGAAGFGHARLSVLDLTAAGNQPMWSADGRYMISYNGEVYNFPELRSELVRCGCVFRTKGDTEVVLEAFVRWGLAAISRLNGIFAFAIWDSRRRSLVLVRDRFGVKPLYFKFEGGRRLLFGSEIKAILQGQEAPAKIDEQGLREFLYFGNTLGKRSLFAGIGKLEPGTTLEVSAEGKLSSRYWRPEDIALVRDDVKSATERVRHLLEAAVKRQLVSDVPIGIFLSGGIDSSAITAYGARHSAQRLRTYSVAFDFSGAGNELVQAGRTARLCGTDHHELEIRGADISEVIRALVVHHDAPFSDAANIPLYLLCRQLRGDIKVVLQGDGGDEVFAGYRRYSLLRHWPSLRTLSALRPFVSLAPVRNPLKDRMRRMLDILAVSNPGEMMGLLLTQELPSREPERILHADWRRRIANTDPFQRYREVADSLSRLDRVQLMLYTDLQILLPDIFLEKVDRSTMAHGIEARVPFLDNDLVEYAAGLPARFKVRSGGAKYILRRALRGIVPPGVLAGRKRGFNVPYSQWLREPLRRFAEGELMEGRACADHFLDRAALELLWREHATGRSDHGFLLWKALNLSLWYEIYQ